MLSMDEKKNDCLEPDCRKQNIILNFHLAMVNGMGSGEKEENPLKPRESEWTGRECSADEVLCKSENYGMTWCTYPKQHGFTPGEN